MRRFLLYVHTGRRAPPGGPPPRRRAGGREPRSRAAISLGRRGPSRSFGATTRHDTEPTPTSERRAASRANWLHTSARWWGRVSGAAGP